MRQFTLVGDRFLWDDYDSGLFFDLAPVKREGGEDDAAFNNRVDQLNVALKAKTTPGNVWYVTFFANPGQIADLPTNIRNALGAKSYLLLFTPDINKRTSPWDAHFADGLICVNSVTGKGYTFYSPDNLGYRFERVDREFVESLLGEQHVPTPTLPSLPRNASEIISHMNCPHCGQRIF